MNRRTLLAGAAALAACSTTEQPAARAGGSLDSAAIDGAVERVMSTLGSTAGVAVAVYTRSGTHTRGYGLTDVRSGERASADTAFYIASTTKPLTSLALASQHVRGDFNLDSTLAAYTPDAPFPAAVRPQEVTFRNLLSHTHGITNNPIAHRVAYSGEHDPQTLWRLLGASVPNTEAPLGRYQYTNSGYNMATVLTDRRTGGHWQDMLRTEIFTRAGMTRSSARMSEATGWSVARPHMLNVESGSVERIYLEKVDQTMQSAGGVIMSANDALKWLELMIEDGTVGGRRVVPAAAVQAVRVPVAPTGGDDNGVPLQYGLGWNVTQHNGEPAYFHSGGFAGARSQVAYAPQSGIGVAVFANEEIFGGMTVEALIEPLYALVVGAGSGPLDTAIAALPGRRDQLLQRIRTDRANRAQRPWRLTRPRAAYAGTYRNENYGAMNIAADGEILNASFGVLRARAEPFTNPESIRVEFVPGQGAVIGFDTEGAAPANLTFQGERFTRA